MANQTIPTLPPLLTATGSEQVWVAFGGSDYRMTTSQIAALSGGGGGGGGGTYAASQISGTTTITQAGYYVVTATGITVTISPSLVVGPVGIADGTYATNPNITINATVNGSNPVVLGNPGESLNLFWVPAGNSWIVW